MTLLCPQLVYDELNAKDATKTGVSALRSAAWIKIVPLVASPTIEPLLLGLDIGEMQVLLLAREVAPDWVLIDERLGRRVAKAMGLPVKGTVGVLLASFHAGFLTPPRHASWAELKLLITLTR